MTWWQILFIIAILGVGAYLFGLFDKPQYVINATSPGGAFCMLLGLYTIATLVLYLTFVGWHKLLGPYIFGG